MRTELPVCKRCCFCLPLRYGLIAWGYIKLIAGVILSILFAGTLYQLIYLYRVGYYSHVTGSIAVYSIMLVLLMLDVALNTVFVIGGHTKNVKLLRVYYIYNLIVLGLLVSLVVIMVILIVPDMPRRVLSYSTWVLLVHFSGSFINIVSQCYFILLLRSEIIKLKNNCKFRFMNNAAEAACTMNCEDGEEKGTEDACSMGTCETEVVCEKKSHLNGTCHVDDLEN